MELERTLPITNKYGLHARASTRLAQVAQKFSCEILVARETQNGQGLSVRSDAVDAKSVIAILSLGAECGDKLHLRVRGNDAENALAELTSLVKQRFHEE